MTFLPFSLKTNTELFTNYISRNLFEPDCRYINAVPIISQLIRFARVCSNVDDFNNRNLFLTAKLLKQGYRYHKIRKAFSKFYHRHSELIVEYNIGLKTLLQQGISEPIFYGDSL